MQLDLLTMVLDLGNCLIVFFRVVATNSHVHGVERRGKAVSNLSHLLDEGTLLLLLVVGYLLSLDDVGLLLESHALLA